VITEFIRAVWLQRQKVEGRPAARQLVQAKKKPGETLLQAMLPSKVPDVGCHFANRGIPVHAIASRQGLVLVDESLNLVAAQF
jgi:hypothetical protein